MDVLVVEQNPERSHAITRTLVTAGHRPEVVGSGTAALAALARPGVPDLLLVAETLPDMPALDFLQAVGGLTGRPPVVLMGEDVQTAQGVEATRLGAVDFVLTDEEGLFLRTLAARVQTACQRSSGRDQAVRMADALSSTSAAVVIADVAGKIELINDACAQLLGSKAAEVAGTELGELFSFESEARLRSDFYAAVGEGGEWAGEIEVPTQGGSQVPCLVTLSPVRRAGGRVDGLVLTLRDVSDRVAMEDALRAANRRLAEQASRDALTSLYNRAYFLEVLEREIARAIRYGDELSVMMIDLDDFKLVNDEHGHAVGDAVLRAVSRRMAAALRDGDVLARYGGDEFCVLLPNTASEAACAAAERIGACVADAPFDPDASSVLTVSIGVATSEQARRAEGGPAEELLRFADRALYESKGAGGARVTLSRD